MGKDFESDVEIIKKQGVKKIVVNGGGKKIKEMMKKIGIEQSFEGGMRVKEEKKVEVVEMVMEG